MPTAPLVADDYIDDPNRTTEEVQDALNSHLDFSREIKFELSTLSSTTFGEGAVRGVGSGAGQLPDTEELNARLNTTGNLGNAATKTMGAGGGLDADLLDGAQGADYLTRNATLVWSGSTSAYVKDGLGAGASSGIYVVRANSFTYAIVINDPNDNAHGTTDVSLFSTEIRHSQLSFVSGNGFRVALETRIESSGSVSTSYVLMNELWKL